MANKRGAAQPLRYYPRRPPQIQKTRQISVSRAEGEISSGVRDDAIPLTTAIATDREVLLSLPGNWRNCRELAGAFQFSFRGLNGPRLIDVR